MVKSIFKIPEAHANLQRNAFDVSNTELFTSCLGQLLPVCFREVNPNEHVEITPELYARTMPLNTAAFVSIKQNLEFFFVPYRLLWSRSQQFFSHTDYSVSTSISGSTPSLNPVVEMKQIANFLREDSASSSHYDDDLGYQLRFGAVRLLDFLGYGDFSPYLSSSASLSSSSVHPNIFKLLAYQKVYQDFYRNEVLEEQDIKSYNVDSLYESMVSAGRSTLLTDSNIYTYLGKWLRIRYRNLRNDYFTSSRAHFTGASWMSQIVSPVVMPFTEAEGTNWLDGVPYSYNNQINGKQGGIAFDDYATEGREITGFTIANLRSAFALDKMYDAMSRAKDGCYAHQMKARFGVEPNLDDYHCRFIGGVDAPVQIGEVVGTSENNLGDIGGKGTSYSNGHTLKFDVKEHGVILGIQSFIPSNDYEANGLDRSNMKTSFSDYLQPEFSDLGYQPIYTTELVSPISSGSDSSSVVYGFNTRYEEYKTAYNRVHGNFRKGRSLSAWCCPIKPVDVSRLNSISWQALKINPSLLDTIMTVQYDGSDDTDQFVCKNSFNIQIVRPISRYGSPYLS